MAASAVLWLLFASWLAVRDALPWLLESAPTAHDDQAWRFNLVALAMATSLSALVGLCRPAWWRRFALLMAVAPMLLLLATSHHVAAGAATVALLFPTIWLGREFATALGDRIEAVDAWAIGSALGMVVLAGLGLILGALGLLGAPGVWMALVGICAALAAKRLPRLRDDLVALAGWVRRPVERRPAELLIFGAAVGCLWLNFIGSLTPETGWDAVKLRLPVAAEWARTGRLSHDDPDLWLATWPAAGEMLYAVALAVGPLATAKLVNFATGLLCGLAIFAVGRRIAGPAPGGLAAVAFYSMPVVSFTSTSAMQDLLVTLLAVVASQAIMGTQRPAWRTLLAPAACIALGVAVKAQFGYVAVGLAVLLGLLSMWRHGLATAARLVAALTALSVLIAFPWLARSYLMTGEVPGLDIALASLSGSPEASPTRVAVHLAQFGYGRSLGDLLLAPYQITFQSAAFGPRPGYIGYLLFALLPLLVLARPAPGGQVLATLAGAATAFLLWFYTAQELRYGLPIFALLCPLAAAAYLRANANTVRTGLGAVSGAALVVLVAAGALPQVLRMKDTDQPDLPSVLGLVDEDTYLATYGHAYPALRLLDAEPSATRAFEPYEMYARVYTRVRLSGPHPLYTGADLDFEGDEREVLRRLDEGGYSHIVVDRNQLPANWDRITAIDERFLGRNTALVGGYANSYLYRLLPPEQRRAIAPWAQGRELLTNGGFEKARGGVPLGWSVYGQPVYSGSGEAACSGRAAVLSSPGNGFSARAAITSRARYLLAQSTRSLDGYRLARLEISWFNTANQVVRIDVEVVPVSPRACLQHTMLATSPPDAVAAKVYAQAQTGQVWFDDFSLRSVAPDVQRTNLLEDPGFEGLLYGTSIAWRPYGNPSQDERRPVVQESPFTSGAAVLVRPKSGFAQVVPVEAERSYRLSYTAWSQDSRARAQLHVDWKDGENRLIAPSTRTVRVGSEPLTYSQVMTAPGGAAFATVYVGVEEGGPVWFDDYALEAID